MFNDLPRTVECVLHDLARWRAYGVKLGRGLPDLLRSDKFILYFAQVEDAMSTEEELRKQLSGVQAHAVPFTFQRGTNALLSIGVDSPSSGHRRSQSWRTIVTSELARIIAKRRALGEDDIVPAVYEDLRRAGIDSVHWKPVSAHWDI